MVNYCPATHTATVTVKECYNLPANERPVSSASLNAPFENEMFQVPNLQEVTFFTQSIQPLRSGGSITYEWQFGSNSGGSFTPSSYSSAANEDITFNTKAPVYNNNATYTLNLQVAAEGYCPFSVPPGKVVVVGSAGQLQGTVEILEVVAPTNPAGPPEMWMVEDRPATLTARYNYEGDQPDQIKLQYEWFWFDDTGDIVYSEITNDGRLYYTPNREILNGTIRVQARDLNGKEKVYKDYPLTVKHCAASNLPELYVNVNRPCGTIGNINTGYAYAYVMDTTSGGTKGYAYRVHALGGRWWFTENLRANKMNDATYHETYGAYYPASALSELANSTNGHYCPKGWRIPSQNEWNELNASTGTTINADQFKALVSSAKKPAPVFGDVAWDSNKVSNLPQSGENYWGFNLVPASAYNNATGSFLTTGTNARFWTSDGGIQMYGHTSGDNEVGISLPTGSSPGHSYTVRCVND
jgi:uncharacterized protein (TIGR02145 family)